ncbi:MAG TPA: XRE family transcriptional regulator [Candidatus Saccharimonadales bacterium]|nr:XRE family transcriptional regulator [Candidatus Saccharimonadales bacterium]
MTESSAVELGKRIKQERLRKGLTLKEIEAKVGISATHVSEIERGRTSPTVGALSKIAVALDTKMSLLVDLRVPPAVVHTSARDRANYQLKIGNLTAEPLLPFLAGPEISLFVLHVPAGERDQEFLRAAAGEVFLSDLKGILEVTLGEERFILKEGDSLHFVTRKDQFIENIGESPARLFAAVSPRMAI